MTKLIITVWITIAVGMIYIYKHQPVYTPQPVPSGVDIHMWRRGRAMYQSHCASCHNVNPDLPGVVGPRLRGVSEELLTDRLTNGKGIMPAQKELLRFVPSFREYLR